MVATKPLGRKAYGSIPHLPGSRMGPGDHKVDYGQSLICQIRRRDRHDRVIVSEKLDGSNVAVARIDNAILALTRSGYEAHTSPYQQHRFFSIWVSMNHVRFLGMLRPGERVNGEWLAQAHGTRYELGPCEPFVAFDMMSGDERFSWDETVKTCQRAGITTPRILSDGEPVSIDEVIPLLNTSGHGAIDPVEGAVWRVERKGDFDFMAKWVRPDKEDGKYLTEITGHPGIWHWKPF